MSPDFSYDRPDFDDHEYIWSHNGWDARISKVGGGMLGSEYSGWWHYVIRDTMTGRVWAGSDMHTGTPKLHSAVAEELIEIATEEYY